MTRSLGRKEGARKAGAAVLRVGKNLVMQSLTTVLRAASLLGVTILIARLSTIENLGFYSYAFTFSSFAWFGTDLGIGLLLTREIARVADRARKYVDHAIPLMSALAMFLCTGLVLASILLGNSWDRTFAILLLSLGLGIHGLTVLLRGAFYGVERMELETVAVLTQETTFFGGAYLVLALGLPFLLVFAAYAGSRLIGYGIAWTLYRTRFGSVRLRFDRRFSRELFQEALPFMVHAVFALLYTRSGVLVLSHIVGDAETGVFEVVYNVSIRLILLANLVTSALFPILSRTYAVSRARFVQLHGYLTKYLAILAMPLAVVLLLAPGDLVQLVYGLQHASVELSLRILALAMVVKFIGLPYGMALTASDKQADRAKVVVWSALACAGLNLYLVPRIGLMGAIISTAACEALLFLMFAVVGRRRLGLKLAVGEAWKAIPASALMALFILLVKPHAPLVLWAPLALCVYFLPLLALGVLSGEEKTILRTAYAILADMPNRRNEANSD